MGRIDDALSRKAQRHNANVTPDLRVTVAKLRAIYVRGASEFQTRGRRGVSCEQWAQARVNKFLSTVATGGVNGCRDRDLLPAARQLSVEGHLPNDPEFERLHPRGWHGRWIEKGDKVLTYLDGIGNIEGIVTGWDDEDHVHLDVTSSVDAPDMVGKPATVRAADIHDAPNAVARLSQPKATPAPTPPPAPDTGYPSIPAELPDVPVPTLLDPPQRDAITMGELRVGDVVPGIGDDQVTILKMEMDYDPYNAVRIFRFLGRDQNGRVEWHGQKYSARPIHKFREVPPSEHAILDKHFRWIDQGTTVRITEFDPDIGESGQLMAIGVVRKSYGIDDPYNGNTADVEITHSYTPGIDVGTVERWVEIDQLEQTTQTQFEASTGGTGEARAANAPTDQDLATVAALDINALRSGAVDGYEPEYVDWDQGGINDSFFVHSPDGKKYFVKSDVYGGQEGVQREVDAANLAREVDIVASRPHATANGSALVSDMVGAREGLRDRGSLWQIGHTDEPNSSQVQLTDPLEALRVRLFDIAIVNEDRHSNNIRVGADDAGNSRLMVIDHGEALKQNADSPLAYAKKKTTALGQLAKDAVMQIDEQRAATHAREFLQKMRTAISNMHWENAVHEKLIGERVDEMLANVDQVIEQIMKYGII